MTVFCVTFTTAEMAAFKSPVLLVCFSRVFKGEEKS